MNDSGATVTNSESADPRDVLVVDDSSLNRELARDFLDHLGFSARTAPNGEEALRELKQKLPDLLLLDVEMPVMDGFAVLEARKERPEWQEMPVIMISGRDDVQNIARALELGADDFIAKPFNQTVLEARIASSLERRDLRARQKKLLRELESSYKNLQDMEAARDQLVHMIAHDLGNPLSVVQMNAEMLAMKSAGGQQQVSADMVSDRVALISQAARSLSEMIQSMLDVSRLESGEMPVEAETAAVCPLLAEQAGQFRIAAEERGMDLESTCDDADIAAVFDPTLVRRTISNLILNAVKYAEGATAIVLEAQPSPEGEHVHIIVQDNGAGIPEGLHDRIFEKFYQVETGKKEARAGVGLGLTFCRLATEAQGGSIRAEAAPGGGTRFVISLPGPDSISS